MRMRSQSIIAAALGAFMHALGVPSAFANAADAGQEILQTRCAECHAIGQTGDSPHDQAPPFRAVMKIYPADSLEEALAEGLVTGHPDMPEFVFPPEQVDAIITYLRTLEALP